MVERFCRRTHRIFFREIDARKRLQHRISSLEEESLMCDGDMAYYKYLEARHFIDGL